MEEEFCLYIGLFLYQSSLLSVPSVAFQKFVENLKNVQNVKQGGERDEEVKIAGDYHGVRIFVTDSVQKQNGSK